jgi:hypothetical protein
MRELMGNLKLTVNEEKTRICKIPEWTLAFLGGDEFQLTGKLPAVTNGSRPRPTAYGRQVSTILGAGTCCTPLSTSAKALCPRKFGRMDTVHTGYH